MNEPKYPDVSVKLTSKDGNVFAIIGLISSALGRAGHTEGAEDWAASAMSCGGYDEVLRLAINTVKVS